MFDLFRSFFRPASRPYEQQREELQSANVRRRMTLARDSRTNKEILYYLAEKDPDPRVRKAVAENKAMPPHASPVLAMDSDADVRLALAGRLVDLLPGVSQDKHSQLYAFVVQALGTLALDEVLRIRTALSSTLKDHAQTPPKVAGQLARDVEREVAEPILRFCAALSDEDLLDILSNHPAQWVIRAIANRDLVSAPVSEAVIEADDPPAGSDLIGNEGAVLTTDLLTYIVEKSRSYPEWQKPVALRKGLPLSVARELAAFVDASVRDLLMKRGDFDEAATEEIAAIFRRRMAFSDREERSSETAQDRLKRLISEGGITEDVISDAMGMRDWDFVYGAVAWLAKSDAASVRKIYAMKAPKPIVALCWHAGLSMRMAFRMQKEIGHIPLKELIYPRDGTDYPLSEADMNWQLEFLGLKAA